MCPTYVQLVEDGHARQEKASDGLSGNQSLQESRVAATAQRKLQSGRGHVGQFLKLSFTLQIGKAHFGQFGENEVLDLRFASQHPANASQKRLGYLFRLNFVSMFCYIFLVSLLWRPSNTPLPPMMLNS